MNSPTVILLFAIVSTVTAQNIDTVEPIVRSVDSLNVYGYFGFSVVLHRVGEDSSTFSEYLQNTRIIVSAPNGTATDAEVENTGVLFVCPVAQGTCEPLRGNNNGFDRRLYDEDDNAGRDQKDNQFLGVSMDSQDNMFIVCAHRFIDRGSSGNSRNPLGKCFYTENRELEDFQEFHPCRGRSSGVGAFGVCQAGSSVALADEGDGNIAIGVGAPGSYSWRGIIFRQSSSGELDEMDEGQGTTSNGWQGYSMTKGHIIDANREDFIVSVTRTLTYFGTVNIVTNTDALDIVNENQQYRGLQMGEYYGFSLAAVDLNGDGMDELLVGAPMYSRTGIPEAGRVYVYRNVGGSLEFFIHLTAPTSEEYTRFGHSITNLGDINGDGLEDVAIGAPFGKGSGIVYIYHGSVADIISLTPQQEIVGSEITESLTAVNSPKGFGYSLASGLDVDGNGLNDLVIGAYESQQVFLLRSRAVARVTITLTSNPSVVVLDDKICRLQGVDYACFNVTACATFPGGTIILPDNIELEFTFIGDRRNAEVGLEQRIFFNNVNQEITQTVSRMLSKGDETCVPETVYVKNGITDRINGFPIELSISGPNLTSTNVDGNPIPTNLLSVPTVSISGTNELQVETFKDCEGSVCIPNLVLTFLNVSYESSSGDPPTSLVAGLVTNFNVWMTFSNENEDAFLSQLSFTIPTAQFEFIRIEPRRLLITCSSVVGDDETVWTCLIANPLSMGQSLTLAVRLQPTKLLTGAEGIINLKFVATSVNEEIPVTLQNNNFTLPIELSAIADIFIDLAQVNPEQVTYSTSNISSSSNITDVTDLGPRINVSFVIRNSGPSTVPNIQLSIFWPLQPAGEDLLYYLYPAQRTGVGSSTIICETTYINPRRYTIPSNEVIDDDEEEGGVTTGGKKKRRRRNILLERRKRSLQKRQEVDGISDVTINCRTDPDLCVNIVCNILQLGNTTARVDIVSYLHEEYFQSQSDRFTFIPYANLSIVGSSYIRQPDNHRSDEAEVQIRAVTSVPSAGRNESVPLWIIIVPIVLGLLFFAVLAVILYFVGFFRLKSRQKKEEISAQILEEQQGGETPDFSTPT